MDIENDFGLDYDFELDPLDDDDASYHDRGKRPEQPMRASSYRGTPAIRAKRYSSERQIEETCGFEIADGESLHVISQGDIDSLTFLRWIIRQQRLDYCLISSWCIGADDCDEILGWIKSGRIGKCDIYVGEIFKGTYRLIWDRLCEEFQKLKCGRICLFRNHAKVMAGIGAWPFVIESSANINTNPRSENTVITRDDGLYQFYKDFYDKIIFFEKNFQDWKPWR